MDRSVSEPCDTTTTTNSFDQHLKTKEQIQTLEDKLASLTTESEQAQQVLFLLLLTSQDPQNNPQVQAVSNLINTNTKRIPVVVSILCTIKTFALHVN